MCRLYVLLLALCAVCASRAQSEAQLSQYYEVPSYYNPAAIGLTDMVHIRVGSRLQWVGIDHAPRAVYATADMPVKLGTKRIAVGLTLKQKSEGLYRHMNVNVQAGYKFKALKGQFTAAVQAGFGNEQFRGSEVYIPDGDDYHQGTDDAIPRTDVAGNALTLGAGVWYVHPKFWAGVGATHLNSPVIRFSDSAEGGASSTETTRGDYEYTLRRTVNFMAGGNIPIKNTLFEVLPSVMVKSDFAFTRAEITGRMRYRKLFTFGLGYRFDDAIIATIGVEYKGFFAGYAYDYSTSAISRASSGSHEITAGYSLKLNLSDKNKNRHKSIRLM